MAADTAPQGAYRVRRGIVHYPGGVAHPGDVIALPPEDGDPLCVGAGAVLECTDAPIGVPAGVFDVTSTPPVEAADVPVGPQSAPAPRRRRAKGAP